MDAALSAGGAAAGPPAVDDAVIGFLDHCRDVALFCRDSHGRPIGYPMRTLSCHRDGLYFTTYAKSAKVRHLRLDPRVCVLAAMHRPDDARWVSVSGVATVVVPSEDDIARAFVPPDTDGWPAVLPPAVPGGMEDHVKQRLREGKRVLLRIAGMVPTAVHLERVPPR